jgi:hypothetical protein
LPRGVYIRKGGREREENAKTKGEGKGEIEVIKRVNTVNAKGAKIKAKTGP